MNKNIEFIHQYFLYDEIIKYKYLFNNFIFLNITKYIYKKEILIIIIFIKYK